MGKGKILTVCGGILTLVATYVLCWYKITINYFYYYTNGIGALKNFLNIFLRAQSYADYFELPLWIIYVSSVLVVFTLISGVVQLLIFKKRIFALLGSIIPIVIGIMIILGFTVFPEWLKYLVIFGDRNPLIAGAFPLNLPLPGRPESLGTYVLLAGGILGVIGFYYSKEEIF